MLGALLASLVCQSPRFIRHQSHGLDDAASLVVDGAVLRAHQLQEDRKIGGRGSGAQPDFLQLGTKLWMKLGALLAARPLVRTDESGGSARSRVSRGAEGPYVLRI